MQFRTFDLDQEFQVRSAGRKEINGAGETVEKASAS